MGTNLRNARGGPYLEPLPGVDLSSRYLDPSEMNVFGTRWNLTANPKLVLNSLLANSL